MRPPSPHPGLDYSGRLLHEPEIARGNDRAIGQRTRLLSEVNDNAQTVFPGGLLQQFAHSQLPLREIPFDSVLEESFVVGQDESGPGAVGADGARERQRSGDKSVDGFIGVVASTATSSTHTSAPLRARMITAAPMTPRGTTVWPVAFLQSGPGTTPLRLLQGMSQ